MNSDLITAFDPKYEIGKKRENKNNERLRKNEIRKRRKVDDWRNRGNGETRCESSGNLHLKRSSSLGIEWKRFSAPAPTLLVVLYTYKTVHSTSTFVYMCIQLFILISSWVYFPAISLTERNGKRS